MNATMIANYFHTEQIRHMSCDQYIAAMQFYQYGYQALTRLYNHNTAQPSAELTTFLNQSKAAVIAFEQQFIPNRGLFYTQMGESA